MVTVTLNPVSRGSQATSVLEKEVSKMSTRCSEAAQTEFLGHMSTNCASLKGSRSLQQHRHFFWHLQVSKENFNHVGSSYSSIREASEHPLCPSAAGSGKFD